jgi:hypothetical protein
MPKKRTYNPASAFDDRSLPKNKVSVSVERSEEIDAFMRPVLEEEIAKLKQSNPDLFPFSSKEAFAR